MRHPKYKMHSYPPQALRVYYAERPYRYMPTKEAILCVEHRSQLFSSNPSAYGNGEFYPAEECEMCKCEKEVKG